MVILKDCLEKVNFKKKKMTNFRKMTANNPNVDLVSINSDIKFIQNLCICSRDIKMKRNSGINQRP